MAVSRSSYFARIFLVLLITWQTIEAAADYSQYVNPFLGGAGPYPDLAYGGGDIFVGGAVPFGSVKVGIDTFETNVSFAQINGGWTPKGLVTGVSMLHVSGTGAAPKYGVIPQMPLTTIDAPVNLLDNTTYWQERVGNDSASVGYYRTTLKNGVGIELSASHNAGIMQYQFPAGEKHIVVDVSHYLPASGYNGQTFNGGEIHLNGSSYTGFGIFGGGWNEGAPFPVFFCGEFDTAPDGARTFRGANTDPMARLHGLSSEPTQQAVFSNDTSAASGWINDRIGAVFSWQRTNSTATIKSKVGISFVSAEKACKFKQDEISSWDLNTTTTSAVKQWNDQVFSKVQVPTEGPSVNQTNLVLLYSSLYFMHLMPADRSGDNPFWDSGEPYWDDFYTLWDLHRCTISLYHLIQPKAYEGMIRALIDTWKYEGYMPDGRSGFWNGEVQGGSNSDNVLADAYVKGLRGDINWTAGYKAMLKNAEVLPINTFSHDDESASVKEGRAALDGWLQVGYVPRQSTRCISRTTEYSVNDYALSVVAAGEAPGDVQKYLQRSTGWQKLWNDDIESRGFRGFLAPKNLDGTWNLTGYDVLMCGAPDCGFLAWTFQTVPWETSFTLPHDMQSVIEKMGGPAEFERRLDYIFLPNTSAQSLDVNGAGITTIMNIGNEPDFGLPYLYNYLNKSYKSVEMSRMLANQYFQNRLYGLPGNSDAGATNSWLAWSMLGLYPITTQPVYLLESPWFDDINMTVNGNATLRIRSNGNPMTLGQSGYRVKSVRVNGQAWDKNWLNHEDVMVSGGTIEFDVGDDAETVWEKGDVPPSPGHV